MSKNGVGHLEGTGSMITWGFTPSMDLRAASSDLHERDDGATLHILVAGAGDTRHVLQTVARHRRHTQRPVQIYVVENKMEHLARQLLQWHIALDEGLELREREQIFLEVFGNCHLRGKTAVYVEEHIDELIRLVTSESNAKWKDLLKVDEMKHKERDELEDIFKSWRMIVPFDIEELRDERLRALYGRRYDSRLGVLDWDYHMKLIEIENCSIIHPHEYRNWRQEGNAFRLDGDRLTNMPDPTVPNRTLAAYAEGKRVVRGRTGGSVLKRGFWGDCVNSPYIAFGVEANEPSLFKKSNKTHVHNAQDVSEYNMISLLQELASGERVTTKERAVELGATGITGEIHVSAETAAEKAVEAADAAKAAVAVAAEAVAAASTPEETATAEENLAGAQATATEKAKTAAAVEAEADAEAEAEAEAEPEPENGPGLAAVLAEMGVTVHHLWGPMPTAASTALKRLKYHGLFDIAFLGSTFAHEVPAAELQAVLKPDADIVVETARFILEVEKEHKRTYCEKILGFGKEVGWTERTVGGREWQENGASCLHFEKRAAS